VTKLRYRTVAVLTGIELYMSEAMDESRPAMFLTPSRSVCMSGVTGELTLGNEPRYDDDLHETGHGVKRMT